MEKKCPNCQSTLDHQIGLCPNCHYSTIFRRILDDVEQLCVEETLKVVSDPFIVTEDATILEYEKLYKKTIGLTAVLDEKPEQDSVPSLEQFHLQYPEQDEVKRNTEIIMLGQMIEYADELGGNALLNVQFWISYNRRRQLQLNASAQVFKVKPIKKEQVLSDEKFRQIYQKIETEYKNHNLNRNISVGLRNYNMILRLLKSVEEMDLDTDVVRLAAILFEVRQKDMKLFAYYGDPEFASAQEFLEYQGVPAALAKKTEDYLQAMRRKFYVDWSYHADDGKTEQEVETNKRLLETVEGKVLCDMAYLGRLGALGVTQILQDEGGITYDPWSSFGMFMGDDDEYPFGISDIELIGVRIREMKGVFFTDEAKRIAEKRVQFMEEFVREYEAETDGEV